MKLDFLSNSPANILNNENYEKYIKKYIKIN